MNHFCEVHGFSYGITWWPVYGGGTERDGAFIMKEGKPLPERLKVDKLKSTGEFATANSKHHFEEGNSLPGLAFDRRDWALVPDMQAASRGGPSGEQRQDLAKQHNIKGAFAFFRDGAVFEFGGENPIDEDKVQSLLKQFGGTRGPKPVSQVEIRNWNRKSSVVFKSSDLPTGDKK